MLEDEARREESLRVGDDFGEALLSVLGTVDHDVVDAEPFERCHGGRVVTDERTGVREGGAATELGSARLQRDDRLAVRTRDAHRLAKRLRIAHRLEEERDRLCCGILREVRQDVGYEGMRWLTVGPPNQPETGLVLTPPAIDPGLTEEERQTVLDLIAKGSYAALTLATSDLDGLFEKLEKSGAEVLQEPMDQPYGVRDCAFRDPAGNMLRFTQPRSA